MCRVATSSVILLSLALPDPCAKSPTLRAGVRRLLDAGAAGLLEEDLVVDVIRSIGLNPDLRPEYGDESVHMLPVTEQERAMATLIDSFIVPNLTSIKYEGLLQIPQQLACALTSLAAFNVSTFVEIGTFTGWTTSVIAAFFQGLARRRESARLRSWSMDTDAQRVGSCASSQFARLGITFVLRRGSEWPQGLPEAVDLCFIDGDHSYAALSSDFGAASKACRFVMLHDIVGDLGQDVPRFWGEVKADYPQNKVWECTYQPRNSTSLRVMGIGIVQLRE